MGAFLVSIQMQKKLSPLPGFEPTTYQVTVYDADNLPMNEQSCICKKQNVMKTHCQCVDIIINNSCRFLMLVKAV